MFNTILKFWHGPGPIMLAAGADGEILIARLRALIVALILIAPTYKIIVSPGYPVYFWGFWIAVFGAVEAAFVLAILRWWEYRPWLGFTSSICDVTLVSLALALFMLLDYPLVALNSKVTFEIYFLAITATSLRYDARICFTAGLVAIAQYAALNYYGTTHFDLASRPESGVVGTYSLLDQLTRMVMLGAAVGLAYGLVIRGGRLLRMSMYDNLTGIHNRSCFNMLSHKLIEGARRDNTTLAIAMFDVDHFKRINDRFGHPFGDKVLSGVARALESQTRPMDALGRFGGEEFVLTMPNVNADDALVIVERIRAAAVARFSSNDSPLDRPVTLSAGVAMFPDDADQLESLIGIADVRLLRAKQEGRNRVQVT